jgi:hypothetical protein
MYRLILDIPLGDDEKEAKVKAENILADVKFTLQDCGIEDTKNAQYRLSKDDDRAAKNYLNIDKESNRVLTSKLRLF